MHMFSETGQDSTCSILGGLVCRVEIIHNPLLRRYLSASIDGILCNALEQLETLWYGAKQSDMPVKIEETQYFTALEITKQVGISRTTLWRWRSDGKIPAGRLYRGATVVFTIDELNAVRAFANRLEPVQAPNRDQMNLFNGGK
jgi:predicted DNA-binding transcriptional regulator AlpA